MAKSTQALPLMLKLDLLNIWLAKGAKFTKMNPPLRIVGIKSCTNRSEASKLEYQVKQLSALQKRALALNWTEK